MGGALDSITHEPGLLSQVDDGVDGHVALLCPTTSSDAISSPASASPLALPDRVRRRP